MKRQTQEAIALITAGIALPSIFLAATLPGDDAYTDAGGLASLVSWLFLIAPPSVIFLVTGISKLIKSELKR